MGLKNVKDLHWPEIAAATRRDGLDLCRYPGRGRAAAHHPRSLEDHAAPLVIVVDEDCDVRDWTDVMWRVVSSSHPGRDIITGAGPDPAARGDRAMDIVKQLPAPLGIDATFKFKFTEEMPMNKISQGLMDQVASRWKEFGLS